MDKIQIARHQLGTALALFIEDLDPISVHCLACSAGEVIESMAHHKEVEIFTDSLLKTNKNINLKDFRKIRSKYWNAFKHATMKGKDILKEDQELLSSFSDKLNDYILLISWSDYSFYTKKMPIEAQVFQTWFFAIHDETLAPNIDKKKYQNIFPNIKEKTRIEQKKILKKACENSQKISLNEDNIEIKTELDPLIYSSF